MWTSDSTEAAPAVVAELIAAMGADGVRWGSEAGRLYQRDASTFAGLAPLAVCLPRTTGQVTAAVRAAVRHGLAVVTRGSGTGLAGGAVPLSDSLLIVTTRMSEILSVDVDDGVAWVQPGVLNLDLTRHLAPYGYCFAPDPSSQQACTVGGNVANNSGGPHCLAEGVTSAHVVAIEVVLPDGTVVVLGGVDGDPDGYDLRGVFVGSEGTMGIATRVAVRLTPLPPSVRTLLASFDDLDRAAGAVSAVIAAGIVPAALEMIDGPLAAALEDYAHAGLPRDAAAVLLVELEGTDPSTLVEAASVDELLRSSGATSVEAAVDETQRLLWWKARKSAFGAVARILPDYYLHDTVVPRTRLVEVLAEIRRVVEAAGLVVYNVFHAGDGNLHPLVLFDAREPGVMDRVHDAAEGIIAASLAVGGVLSGEHGIGIEKRDHMARQFSDVDLRMQRWAAEAFDPDGTANPDKVLPVGAGCVDLQHLPPGVWI